MATKHYLCDYDIEKKGKIVHSGTVQFARVNVSDEHDEDEAFAAAQRDYGTLKLKRDTFKEVTAVGKIPTNADGNVVGRPAVIEAPTTTVVAVPGA